MTATLSRSEELRNDLENLHFTKRYLIGALAELEDIGQMGSRQYKATEQNLHVVNNNIRRLEAELERAEEDEYLNELEQRFMDEEDLHHWSNE
ncbi:MAG: hypothetical protein IJY23_01145 [Clostridia bacterium]|nr:hypothetical protein [Clostridia bacterium]